MKSSLIAKIILSVFVIYHLVAVTLIPNPDSLLTRTLSPLILPYTNTFGLNTPWQFFSPDPSSHVYFEYELSPPDENSKISTYRWPPASKEGYLADNYMRLIYHSRYTTSSPDRIDQFLIPWLCRHHPGAREITLRTLSEELISIDKATLIGGPIKNLFQVKVWGQIFESCPSVDSETSAVENSNTHEAIDSEVAP